MVALRKPNNDSPTNLSGENGFLPMTQKECSQDPRKNQRSQGKKPKGYHAIALWWTGERKKPIGWQHQIRGCKVECLLPKDPSTMKTDRSHERSGANRHPSQDHPCKKEGCKSPPANRPGGNRAPKGSQECKAGPPMWYRLSGGGCWKIKEVHSGEKDSRKNDREGGRGHLAQKSQKLSPEKELLNHGNTNSSQKDMGKLMEKVRSP
jgi:hypothetical protein